MTDLNRRKVVRKEDEPGGEPTGDDIVKFVRKVEKFRPAIVAVTMNGEVFEKCFRQHYPSAHRQRGKQEFLIGSSEVWLLGGTTIRPKDTDAMEQVFEDLADRLKQLENVEAAGRKQE
jgi:G:T/U-mismatch repair DNA glycosylase